VISELEAGFVACNASGAADFFVCVASMGGGGRVGVDSGTVLAV
jgi:hypothetical protein